MTLQLLVERALCDAIQSWNFESSRTQVVPMHQIEEPAELPRIVVDAQQGESPVLHQVGVYPFTVSVAIRVDAGDPPSQYMLTALSEAVDECLAQANAADEVSNQEVKIYGIVPGDAAEDADGDVMVRTRTATVHAGPA